MKREVFSFDAVAPARERGLKCHSDDWCTNLFRRSRKGAWIEIHGLKTTFDSGFCRSRKGAWIEMPLVCSAVGSLYGRSRKGAWIEILTFPAVPLP